MTSVLLRRQPFLFQWRVTDDQGNPIDGLQVVGTLFAGRNITNPDLIPGLPLPAFSAKPLQSTIEGIYEADIGSDPVFDPPPGNYVLVVDATRNGGSFVGHWEKPMPVAWAG